MFISIANICESVWLVGVPMSAPILCRSTKLMARDGSVPFDNIHRLKLFLRSSCPFLPFLLINLTMTYLPFRSRFRCGFWPCSCSARLVEMGYHFNDRLLEQEQISQDCFLSLQEMRELGQRHLSVLHLLDWRAS